MIIGYECSNSKPDNVYLLSDGERVKIGISGDPSKRVRTLQTGHSHKLTLVAYFPTEDAFKIERLLHKDLAEYLVCGEWFTDCPRVRATFYTAAREEARKHVLKAASHVDRLTVGLREATERLNRATREVDEAETIYQSMKREAEAQYRLVRAEWITSRPS